MRDRSITRTAGQTVTIFEYVMVIISIILGLGITQLLRGFGKIARSETRDLGLVLWATLVFILHLQVWWALWDVRENPDWTQFKFYFIVLIPCTLFAMVEFLVPMSSAPGLDWSKHFRNVRRWFFPLYVFFSFIALLESWLMLGTPLTHPYRIMQLTQMTIGIVGWVSVSERVHAFLPVIAIVMMFVGQAIFRLVPGLA